MLAKELPTQRPAPSPTRVTPAVPFRSLAGPAPNKTPYIIGGAAAVVVVAMVVVWFSFLSTEARMMRAIDRGELFSPQGSSAYDLFSKLKSQGLSAGTRNKLKLKLLPKLYAAADVLLQKRHEGDDLDKADVPRLVQIYQWAAEIAPDDRRVLARYSYAQGYAALLNKDKSSALQFLLRSVEQDNSWAFSFNELGRTYSGLDDRPHAAEN
ncbi:MAG TPA: hypothetical protein VG028_20635 [Terriglobia bacterium]|nr:hypothetical protein [Terriglobia bacterium]